MTHPYPARSAGDFRETTADAKPVTEGQLAAWLFYDCGVAVYACGELAEEILKYFEVRPLSGVELIPPPPALPEDLGT